MGKIDIDFTEATRQAAELAELAGKLRRLSQREFGNNLQKLNACWKGNSALTYLQKGEKLQKHMENTARDLEQAAEEVKRIAKGIYEAELRAKRLAEERKSGGGGR